MASAILIARRLVGAVFVLWLLSVVTFGLLVVMPGNPETTLLGSRPSTPETRAAVRAEFHLDDPVPVRYVRWLGDLLQGDLGVSMFSHERVATILAERLPVTVELSLYALILTLAVGIPAGLAAAARRGRALDQSITTTALVALSVPPFAMSILLLYVFAVQLGWFPVFGAGSGGGASRVAALTLPALALAAGQTAIIIRQMRAAALDLAGQDFMAFARARGLSRSRIWWSYSLRNASLPVLTVGGLLLAANLTGALFVEQAFGLHGLGALFIGAVGQKDIPVVQALVLFGGAVVIIINLLIDFAYLAVDPRLRAKEASG